MKDENAASKPDRCPLEYATTDELILELNRRARDIVIIYIPLSTPKEPMLSCGRGNPCFLSGAMESIKFDLFLAARANPNNLSEGGGA
jgi:hypothetical protein